MFGSTSTNQTIDRKVLCKLCETKLSFVGGTSVMHNHLKVKHPSSAAVAETDEIDGNESETFSGVGLPLVIN